MHLQHHAGRKTTLLEGRRDAHHRDLDQVRRRPLQRRIGRRALAERADVVVAILELRHVAAPSEQCLDIALRTSLRDRKSTRLNSSHRTISYAVFCLKKKNKNLILIAN